jgi:hypothetical protein
VLTFDDLSRNRKKTLNLVFNFLQVNPNTNKIHFRKKNVTKGKARFNSINKILYSKSFKDNPFVLILRKALPQKVKHKIIENIIQFNRKQTNDSQNTLENIDNACLSDLYDYFRKDIENLEELLNWDLKHWHNKY